MNTAKFPSGSLAPLVEQVTGLTAANSTTNLRFGLWFEPEMVNPNSSLYVAHPEVSCLSYSRLSVQFTCITKDNSRYAPSRPVGEGLSLTLNYLLSWNPRKPLNRESLIIKRLKWALSAGRYPRTLQRDQLVLNVALPAVQDFIISSVSTILRSTAISYVKWDNNRGMHELPSPGTDHAYMLGLYRVFANLTSAFPNVLWEGCASGGGRFDPGVLAYFPQIWTSDNTDALTRLHIQFGTSLVYPSGAMGAHLSAVPNGQTQRTIPVAFRAHVAMMGGSFGLELNPVVPAISAEDKAALPGLIALAERVNPLVVSGDLWRLNLPEESNWPAAMFVAQDGGSAVLFWFQVRSTWNVARPYLRLQGLEPGARYYVNGNFTYSGATLMSVGLQWDFEGEYDSTVVFIERL